jgi:hypothetical protein
MAGREKGAANGQASRLPKKQAVLKKISIMHLAHLPTDRAQGFPRLDVQKCRPDGKTAGGGWQWAAVCERGLPKKQAVVKSH